MIKPHWLSSAFLLLIPLASVAGEPAPAAGLPLQADRTIEFTAESGTWMSVDVSPDGRTVVFDLLGDIYTVPIEGGDARCILAGLAFENQPRFSPDGKRIAFISDRSGGENVWVADADGSNPTPLSSTLNEKYVSPAWTPDGASVLASLQPKLLMSRFRLVKYPVRGGKAEEVATNPRSTRGRSAYALGAAPSGDGASLFFAQYDPGESEYNKKPLYEDPPRPISQVVRRDEKTGEEREVTHAPGGGFRPALSPDGSRIAYGSRQGVQTGLRLHDLATGEERWLKVPIQRDDQEGVANCDLLPGYAFTPDGRSIVAAYGGKIHRVDLATGADPVIPFRAEVKLATSRRVDFPTRVEEGPVRARLIQGAAPSPDGKRLAFSALTRLYVMDLPAGPPVQLGAEGSREYLPAWSPDGKWLAYVVRSAEGEHLWKRPSDGPGAPVRLTTRAATYRDPVWSPDGARVVALRGPGRGKEANLATPFDAPERRELIWVAATGGEERTILPPLVASRPHFGPEPDRVYLTTRDGLSSVPIDGGEIRNHVLLSRSSSPEGIEGGRVGTILVSPDGRWALAECVEQVYLVPLPADGKYWGMDLNVFARRLSVLGADEFCWADGGRSVSWTLGATLFRVPFDAARAGLGPPGTRLTEAVRRGRPAAEEIPVVVERPRATPRGTVAFRGAKVVTMRGDEVIDGGDIVVTDHRIVAVGPAGTVAIPEGARVIDLAGQVVVPGFIDTHAHWLNIVPRVLDLDNWNFFATLAYGVTTGRDPNSVVEAFAYRDLVEAGDLVGPRVYSTGPAIYGQRTPGSYDEALALATRYKTYYRTDYLKSYTLLGRRLREWLVRACRDVGLMPTTEGFQSLNLQLTYLLDGFHGAEHALPVVGIGDDVVTLLARSGVAYTPALQASYGGPQGIFYFLATADFRGDPKAFRFIPYKVLTRWFEHQPWSRREVHVFPGHAEAAARAARAGGRVCVGSHGEMQGLGFHWEMQAMATGGSTPRELLRAATIRGAEALGLAQDLGSIEPGKLADLVVLRQDPLVDIRHAAAIRYVVKNGEVFDGDTLDRIWPSPRPLPPLPWWGQPNPLSGPISSEKGEPVGPIVGVERGDAFRDEARGRLMRVTVRGGAWVDSIACTYSNGKEEVPGARHGGDGGDEREFPLDPGESIVGVSGVLLPREDGSTVISSLQLTTDRRVLGPVGTNGQGQPFALDVPAGREVCGFRGRSGPYLNALGIVCRPKP